MRTFNRGRICRFSKELLLHDEHALVAPCYDVVFFHRKNHHRCHRGLCLHCYQGCLWGGPPARPIRSIDLHARPIKVKRALTDQGCHKGRFWRKITVQTSARIRVYPANVVLPADGFLPSADAVKTASARTRKNK
jgi:hypothetical protein